MQWQITIVVSLAPRQIDRGDVSGITGKIQKQGNTEAVPVGRKSVVTALVRNPIITQLLVFVKYIKSLFLIHLVKMEVN